MSKRESKGQRVKSYKAEVIMPDLTRTEVVTVVYFKADEGRFYIDVPPHYAETLGSPTIRGCSVGHYRGDAGVRLSAVTLDEALEGFTEITEKYKELLKQQNKKKVISIVLKYESANHHRPYGADSTFGHSNVGAPALHFAYTIAWEINGALYYYQADDQKNLQRWGVAKGHLLVDWTEAREEFFARMKFSLQGLVDLLVDFMGGLEKDPDAAMLAFTSGRAPLLAAPKE